MKKETDINIDALLRDTFLTVVELRQGTTVRHGMELYRHCQRQVELVRERLKDAGFSRENVERAVRPAGRNGPEPWRHGRRSGHLDEKPTPVAFLQHPAGR